MNKHQKAFLKTLLKSIEQAKSTQEAIMDSIMFVPDDHKKTCVRYTKALERYINGANRMVMECTMAYGKGSNTISAEAVANQISEN